MDERRAAYLEALGLDRWQLRRTVAMPVEHGLRSAPELRETPAPPPLVQVPARPRSARGSDQEWEALQAEVSECTRCALHETRTQTVFGVGEAPGAEEDKRGEPFVGRAGQLLNSMLLAIGLPRERVFIANILKSRPPHNRDPRPEEVAACMPFLMRQIELLQPRIILVVGRIAAQTLLAVDTPLAKLRGRTHRFGPAQTPLVITYHPAYLLRSPGEKRKAWDDLQFAREVFERECSGAPAA